MCEFCVENTNDIYKCHTCDDNFCDNCIKDNFLSKSGRDNFIQSHPHITLLLVQKIINYKNDYINKCLLKCKNYDNNYDASKFNLIDKNIMDRHYLTMRDIFACDGCDIIFERDHYKYNIFCIICDETDINLCDYCICDDRDTWYGCCGERICKNCVANNIHKCYNVDYCMNNICDNCVKNTPKYNKCHYCDKFICEDCQDIACLGCNIHICEECATVNKIDDTCDICTNKNNLCK
jgi:hypothetical protein